MLTSHSPRTLGVSALRALLFCLLALLPTHLWAATYLVTDLNDYDSSNFNNPDTGSLRYAISQAYGDAYAANSSSVVLFQKGLTGTIHLVGTLNVPDGVIVEGPGGGQIKIDGGASSGSTFPDIDVSLGAQGSTAAISGLTIQNGNNNGSSALPSGVTNLGNGGGILVDNNAALSITNCIFTGNMASSGNTNLGDGGALNGSTGSTVTVANCAFIGNTANNGGAVACGADSNSANPTTLTLTGCTFTGNKAGSGGAIEAAGGTATLTNCAITSNTASAANGAYGEGGGIEVGFGSISLSGCTLANNTGRAGGGLLSSGTATLTNCLIFGNSAVQGGGLANLAGAMTVTDCTLTHNVATQSGGYSGGAIDEDAVLTNDILYGNTDGSGSISEIASDYPGGSVTHCDIDETIGSGTDNFTDGGGNINQNPMFVNAPNDLHLLPGSPCIGVGATQSGAPTGVTLPATDLDGSPRPASSTAPTIGAYEGYELIVNIAADPDNNAGGNGTTLSLREAVNQANAATSFVRVIFDPTVFATAQTITEASSLGMVKLTGSMSIQGPASGVSVSGNNSNTVFEISSGTSAAPITLANLTIENGNNNSVSAINGGAGGGVSVDATAAAKFLDCHFTNNNANTGDPSYVYGTGGAGGGVGSVGGSLTLTDCTFTGNSALFGGGGLSYYDDYSYGVTSPAAVTVTDCTFTDNTAPEYSGGGGLLNYGSAMTLTGCTFTGNSANDGGGISNQALLGAGNSPEQGSTTINLTNCAFTGNTATDLDAEGGGGGMFSSDVATLTNCTFTGNNGNSGGGFNGGDYSATNLVNDIFYGDTVGGLYSGDAGTNSEISVPGGATTASHCDIEQALGTAVNGSGITDNGGNINADPQFFNSPTDLHLDPGSPCDGAGTTTGAPTTDITGLLRPTPPSIGAYEVAAVAAGTTPTTIATATTLASSLNPSTVGQSVTFTATVAPTSGTGTPTGSVTFSVNNVAQPSVALTNGQATFTDSSLASGSDFITAAYSGDANFAASTSSALTQTVNAATTGGGGGTTPTVLHTFAPGLQMISFPETYSSLAAAWNAPTGQTLYTWAGGPDYLTGTSLPSLGQGAWVYLTQSVSVYSGGTSAPSAGPFLIPLLTGWNMIGDPFSSPVALSSVTVSASGGGPSYSLPAGDLQALAFTTLYTYPASAPGSGAPYTAVGLSDSLEPYAGYWIYAFQPCTLQIPAP